MRLYRCRYSEAGDYNWTRHLREAKRDAFEIKKEILSYAYYDDYVTEEYADYLEIIYVDLPGDVTEKEITLLESGGIELSDLNIDVKIKIKNKWRLQPLRHGRCRWVVG